jgi:hypothetical protein
MMELFKTMTILFFVVVAFVDASWTTTSATVAADTDVTATAAAVVPPPPITINCQTCPTGYYDGCNVCGCGSATTAAGGTTIISTGVCTFRYCANPGTPSCHDKPQEPKPKPPNPTPTPPFITDFCRVCSKGYWDGCNNCLCKPGRFGACTKRACPPGVRLSQPECF